MEVQQKPEASSVVKKVIFCPKCATQHIDRGEWAEKVHHNHLCLKCGEVFDVGEYSFGVLGTREEVKAVVDAMGFVPCGGCKMPHLPGRRGSHGMAGVGESPHEDIAVVLEHHVAEINQLVTLLRDPSRTDEKVKSAALQVSAAGTNVTAVATLVRMRINPLELLMDAIGQRGSVAASLMAAIERRQQPEYMVEVLTPEEFLDLTGKKKDPA